MEEVDNIIIHTLRQVGCDIEEEVDTLRQFTADLIVEAAVRCLDIIQPGHGLPHSLPPSMSARFRLGASIAQACMDLGYTGEIGYQTFLYSNETDVRRVFMFLIEKLPKESEKSIVEPSGRIGLLEKEISDVLKKQLSSPWIPSFCRRRGVRWRDDGTWSREGCGHYQPFVTCMLDIPKTKGEISQAWRGYYVHHLPLVTEQPVCRRQLLPSLIVFNETLSLPSQVPTIQAEGGANKMKLAQHAAECFAHDLEKCSQVDVARTRPYEGESEKINRNEIVSRFALSEKLQFSKDENNVRKVQNVVTVRPDADEIEVRRRTEEEKIQDAKEQTERLREKLENLQLHVKTLTAKLSQVSEESSREERVVKEMEECYSVKKRTYDLLPDADTNLNKLQAMVESSAQKLVGLAAQWEKHRAPLLAQYRDAKERNSNRASESQKQADAVRSMREKVRELSDEVRSKEQLHTQLLTEYEKVSKDTNIVSRSAYTRRIMEIIANIRKQKEEIDKVLNVTKELQKEINNITGRLDRSFTDADERIFRDAKKDEVSRRAYKLLATLHSDCSELVQMVEETGATVREIRDLEEQIDTEIAKDVGANLERVTADLKQMQDENTTLTAQLKLKMQNHNEP